MMSSRLKGFLPFFGLAASMGFLMKKYCRMGSSVWATTIEMNRTMVMAHGNHSRKSWPMPVMTSRNGKKVTEMHKVAVKMDFRKWTVASMEACQRDLPSAIISM